MKDKFKKMQLPVWGYEPCLTGGLQTLWIPVLVKGDYSSSNTLLQLAPAARGETSALWLGLDPSLGATYLCCSDNEPPWDYVACYAYFLISDLLFLKYYSPIYTCSQVIDADVPNKSVRKNLLQLSLGKTAEDFNTRWLPWQRRDCQVGRFKWSRAPAAQPQM